MTWRERAERMRRRGMPTKSDRDRMENLETCVAGEIAGFYGVTHEDLEWGILWQIGDEAQGFMLALDFDAFEECIGRIEDEALRLKRGGK